MTLCRHAFVFDPEMGEAVCSLCGVAFSIYENPSASPDRSPISRNEDDLKVGSDQNEVIRELRRGVPDPSTGKRIHLLSGALRFFPRGRDTGDEDLEARLVDRLRGRVSESDLAAVAMLFGKALRTFDKERRRKALGLLNELTGGDGIE